MDDPTFLEDTVPLIIDANLTKMNVLFSRAPELTSDDSLDRDDWQERLLDLTASSDEQMNGNKHSSDDNYDTVSMEITLPVSMAKKRRDKKINTNYSSCPKPTSRANKKMKQQESRQKGIALNKETKKISETVRDQYSDQSTLSVNTESEISNTSSTPMFINLGDGTERRALKTNCVDVKSNFLIQLNKWDRGASLRSLPIAGNAELHKTREHTQYLKKTDSSSSSEYSISSSQISGNSNHQEPISSNNESTSSSNHSFTSCSCSPIGGSLVVDSTPTDSRNSNTHKSTGDEKFLNRPKKRKLYSEKEHLKNLSTLSAEWADQEKASPRRDNKKKVTRSASVILLTQNLKALLENSITKSSKRKRKVKHLKNVNEIVELTSNGNGVSATQPKPVKKKTRETSPKAKQTPPSQETRPEPTEKKTLETTPKTKQPSPSQETQPKPVKKKALEKMPKAKQTPPSQDTQTKPTKKKSLETTPKTKQPPPSQDTETKPTKKKTLETSPKAKRPPPSQETQPKPVKKKALEKMPKAKQTPPSQDTETKPTKKKTLETTPKTKQPPPSQETLSEPLRKKKIKTRTQTKLSPSPEVPTRRSLRPRKVHDSSHEDKITPQLDRRSTMDFVQPSSKRLNRQNIKCIRRYIVCTRFHSFEVDDFESSVKKLGGFTIENAVTKRTTHLIAGEPKRTLNLMRAIILGCWILKPEWLILSVDKGEWLPEEDFELTDFSPAVKECRKQRQAFGAFYSMDIFDKCGPIYVAQKSVPPRVPLENLIKLCKGKITRSIRNADIAVGEYIKKKDTDCVGEQWILDSIIANKRKSFKNYFITSKN